MLFLKMDPFNLLCLDSIISTYFDFTGRVNLVEIP